MKNYEIDAKRILCIPDFHQELNWVKQILEKEKNNYDHLIILGDEFDSFYNPPEVAGVEEVASFILDMQNKKYGPCTMIMGNHGLPYMESWQDNQRNQNRQLLYTACSGFTFSKSHKINKILKWENWRKYKIFCIAQGFLFSHAGFTNKFIQEYLPLKNNLDRLNQECDNALENIANNPSKFFGVGRVRGGLDLYGGPLWNDYNYEFESTKGIKQIFGHTNCELPNISFFGKNNKLLKRSYNNFKGWDHSEISINIDCHQSYYLLLNDGKLEFKKLGKTKSEKITDELKIYQNIMNEFKNYDITNK